MSKNDVSQKKRLGKNIVFVSIGSFGSKLLTFFFLPLYTNVLTTEEYGTADLVTTIVSLCFPIFSLVIDQALLRFALNEEKDNRSVYSVGFRLFCVGGIVFLLLSPAIFFVPTLKDYYVIFILYYFAQGVYQVQSCFTQGCEKMMILSVAGIINTGVTILANIIFLILLKMGIIGYMLASILGNFISFSFMFISTKSWKNFKRLEKAEKSIESEMLNYSVPMLPNQISWWISNFAGKFFVTAFCGVAINGIYSVAFKIPTIISVVSGIFMSAWRISAVYKFQSDDSKNLYAFTFKYLYIGSILCASLLLVLNKGIAGLLYSNEFYVAWKVVPILLIGSVFHVFSEFYGTIYTSAKSTKFLMQSSVIGAVLNIILSIILIPFFDIWGAATATTISYFIICVIRMKNSKKIISFAIDKFQLLGGLGVIAIQMVFASMDFGLESAVCFVGFLAILMLFGKDIYSLLKSMLSALKKNESR